MVGHAPSTTRAVERFTVAALGFKPGMRCAVTALQLVGGDANTPIIAQLIAILKQWFQMMIAMRPYFASKVAAVWSAELRTC